MEEGLGSPAIDSSLFERQVLMAGGKFEDTSLRCGCLNNIQGGKSNTKWSVGDT